KEYVRDAKTAYETEMRLAYYGAAEYPQVRTFQHGINNTGNIPGNVKFPEDRALPSLPGRIG
ncbi:unnamed protein product, partial [Dicrocoelium dendriticum]